MNLLPKISRHKADPFDDLRARVLDLVAKYDKEIKACQGDGLPNTEEELAVLCKKAFGDSDLNFGEIYKKKHIFTQRRLTLNEFYSLEGR